MTTGASGATCDTSVLVPALAAWHPDHHVCREAIDGRVTSVPSHVLLETYSVLTRLPAPHRIGAVDAAAVIDALPFEPLVLGGPASGRLVALAARSRIHGGGVYDVLIAATAQGHRLRLLTRDRRARRAYDAVGVGYALV